MRKLNKTILLSKLLLAILLILPLSFNSHANETDVIKTESTSTHIKKVTAILPMSGKYASVTIHLRRAIEMAWQEYAPSYVEINFLNSKGNKEEVSKLYNKAYNDNTDLIIGPLLSSSTEIITNNDEFSIPTLSFTSASAHNKGNLYTTGISPEAQGIAIAKAIGDLEIETSLILGSNNKFSELFIKGLYEVNPNFTLNSIFYDEKEPNYKELAEKIKSLENIDDIQSIIFAETSPKKIRILIQQLAFHDTFIKKVEEDEQIEKENINKKTTLNETGEETTEEDIFIARDIQFFGTISWSVVEKLEKEQIFHNSLYIDINKEKNEEFSNKFNQYYGYTPPLIAAIAYDIAMVSILSLIEDKINPITYYETYHGASGLFRFFDNGDMARTFVVKQINRNERKDLFSITSLNSTKKDFNIDEINVDNLGKDRKIRDYELATSVPTKSRAN